MKLIKKKSKALNLPPGSLVHIGDRKTDEVKISLIDYNSKNIIEKKCEKIEDCFQFKKKTSITWINIDGLHDTEVVEKIGKHYNIHPLTLEDILNTDQRPKIESTDSFIFLVLKMLRYDDIENRIVSEQISIIFGNSFVLSFQEKPGDVFDSIRNRIRNNKGRVRKQGADYLAYALIDSIVDNYFFILEKLGEKIEDLEFEVIDDPNPKTLQIIHDLRREIIDIRRSIWPLREVISWLLREETRLIRKTTNIFLRDLYDHTIQVIDTVETFRDIISSMFDIYMSSVSNKMNEVMKVLTIFAAIFIPLTFIAGVYGMNFEYMPELGWKYSYPLIWLVIIFVTVLMLVYFKKKKWL